MSATWQIITGDCRDVLRSLPAGSVHTCVTSPPYFGLRDYGTGEWDGGDPACDHVAGTARQDASTLRNIDAASGRRARANNYPTDDGGAVQFRDVCGKCGARRVDRQIGLEPTPDEFVAALVEVFREVRRVLRDDGTVWLNLGSSYLGSGERQTGRNDTDRETPGGRGGSFRGGARTSLGRAAGGSDPSQSRQPQRAPACGSDGTEPQDSTAPDSACRDLCDGCRGAIQTHRGRSDCTDPLPARDAPPPSLTGRDSERSGCEPAPLGASPLGAPASTTPRSSEPPPGACSHCANCGACLSVLRSSLRDARLCARTARRTTDTEPLGSESRNQDTDASGMAWVNYTRRLKPKDMIPIPWMVAMALQADGWYLRCDVIWAKKNCMPESVTDRPTKAHEYVFLLSKEPSYFYDADAIREAPSASTIERWGEATPRVGVPSGQQFIGSPIDTRANSGGEHSCGVPDGGRNKRSVWTVATQPYAGAHFATFPPKLIEPCILAGCPEGGTVLDPFAGAGTTGMVALRHGRSFVGVELSPAYAEMARRRIVDDQPLFNQPSEVAA